MMSIDELMTMERNATPGTWRVVVNNLYTDNFTYTRHFIENGSGEIISRYCKKSDAEYIVNACNQIPVLIQKSRNWNMIRRCTNGYSHIMRRICLVCSALQRKLVRILIFVLVKFILTTSCA